MPSPRDQDEELDYRRLLLRAAANGDLVAQQVLEHEYHAWVFPKQRKNNPRHILRLPKTKKDRPEMPKAAG